MKRSDSANYFPDNYRIFSGQFTGHFGSNRQFRVFVNGERLNHLTDYITRPMPGGYETVDGRAGKGSYLQ